MDLFQEYEKQQQWRSWERYLQFIPFKSDDIVLDVGCSVGAASRMFSRRVKSVIGIDINQEFIEFCDSHKTSNEIFICNDLLSVDYSSFGGMGGVWGSFSLSYIRNPLDYLRSLHTSMSQDGWIALLDVSCFISGNLAKSSKYHDRVKAFELESHKTGLYDFDFGARMQEVLQDAEFSIVHFDDDVTDPELNFSGAATPEVIEGWSARLSRMKMLRNEFREEYPDFCNELLSNLRSESHEKRGNLKFIVAKKI